MELVRETGLKIVGNRRRTFALYRCPKCNKEVELVKFKGDKADTCPTCGKSHRRTHGASRGKDRLYLCWKGMLSRGRRTNDNRRPNYNMVRVCPEWSDFTVFKAWAETHGYKEGLTIDRIDNTGNYEPANCQWLPFRINASKDKRFFTEDQVIEIRRMYLEGYTQLAIAKRFGVGKHVIHGVVHLKYYKEVK